MVEFGVGPDQVVGVNEGERIVLAGRDQDPDGDRLARSATLGCEVTPAFGAGAWSWEATAPDGPSAVPVTVTIADGFGNGTARIDVALDVANLPPTLAVTGPAEKFQRAPT